MISILCCVLEQFQRAHVLRRVVVDPVGAAAFGTTAIVALAHGLGVWALVLGAYASEAAQAVVSWYLSRWAPNFRLISFAMWREIREPGGARSIPVRDALRDAAA